MNYFQTHPAFYNEPIRLSEEEKGEPLETLRSFFENCPLSQIRQLLWHMVETSLAVPYSVFDHATERQTLLWFYRELERALEAGLLLCQQHTGKEKKEIGPGKTTKKQPVKLRHSRNKSY